MKTGSLPVFSAIAIKLCNMGPSEEEAFIHIRRNNWGHVTERNSAR